MQSLELSWKPLDVKSARSLVGSKLERRPDGSWLAGGENPATDSYVIEARMPDEERITGIRIEALPDSSLPRGGPGRDVYGNFTLTNVRVESVSPSERRTLSPWPRLRLITAT